MKCENCGKEINKIVTNFFDIDGSDYEQEIFIEQVKNSGSFKAVKDGRITVETL